jgi:multiple antibiotic resistance protein
MATIALAGPFNLDLDYTNDILIGPNKKKLCTFMQSFFMHFNFNQLVTVVFTLFAVIDIVGSIPLLISMKEKAGVIKSMQVTLISGGLMVAFLFLGKPFLSVLGLDVKSFAVGGSIVIFLLGLEMVL